MWHLWFLEFTHASEVCQRLLERDEKKVKLSYHKIEPEVKYSATGCLRFLIINGITFKAIF